MAALHLLIMLRCIRPYQLVSYSQPCSLRFKQRGQVPPTVGKLVRKFKTSKLLSICTHSTVIPLRLNAAITFRKTRRRNMCFALRMPPALDTLSIRRSPCTDTASIPVLQCSCAARPLRRPACTFLAAPSVYTASACISLLSPSLPQLILLGASLATGSPCSTYILAHAFAFTVPRFPTSGCDGACRGSACAFGGGCAAVLTGQKRFHASIVPFLPEVDVRQTPVVFPACFCWAIFFHILH